MSRDHSSQGIRGYRAYATLMRTVMDGNVSTDTLAEKQGLAHSSVYEIMRRLHRQRVVHIGGWDRYPKRGCGWHELWSLGEGADAPRPVRTSDGRPSLRKRVARPPFRSQIFTFGLLMLALADGHTPHSLVEITGLDRRWINVLLRFMKDIHLIHIGEWYRNPFGSPSPVLKLGDKRNASKPKPLGRGARDIEYAGECERREEWRSLLHIVAAPLPATAFA